MSFMKFFVQLKAGPTVITTGRMKQRPPSGDQEWDWGNMYERISVPLCLEIVRRFSDPALMADILMNTDFKAANEAWLQDYLVAIGDKKPDDPIADLLADWDKRILELTLEIEQLKFPLGGSTATFKMAQLEVLQQCRKALQEVHK